MSAVLGGYCDVEGGVGLLGMGGGWGSRGWLGGSSAIMKLDSATPIVATTPPGQSQHVVNEGLSFAKSPIVFPEGS